MNRTADVTVIGGGAVGTSLAYFLAKKNMDVLLIEKGADMDARDPQGRTPLIAAAGRGRRGAVCCQRSGGGLRASRCGYRRGPAARSRTSAGPVRWTHVATGRDGSTAR